MSQLSPAELKPHLSLADEFVGDDTRIQGLIDAAETRIINHLRRDLNAEYPGGWPADIKHAVKVYVAYLDAEREPDEAIDMKHGLPVMVAELVASYRSFV